MTSKEHYERNRESILETQTLYRGENRERISARESSYRNALRLAAFDHYGTKCACCGETNPAFLDLDHIAGDGAAWRLEMNGNNGRKSVDTYRVVKRLGYPPIFQTMCSNCNSSKYHNGNVCPHVDGGATFDARVVCQSAQSFRKLKVQVKAAYGNACACPGCEPVTIPLMLTLDHISNDGADHKERLSGHRLFGANIYVYLDLRKRGYPNEVQLVCFNCNVGRARTGGGECPHLMQR